MAKKEKELYSCPVCSKEIMLDEFVGGVCKKCDKKGCWVDPAGGVHYCDDLDYDPASVYI